MKTELKNIASVQMGYSFRSRIESPGYGADAGADCHANGLA